ncbi:MAG: ABC transporter ATP-binding protein [Pseudomonadota bacterium]
MTAPDYAIEAAGLEKTYRASGKMPEKRALKAIDLQIPTGSIFGLLGPNGAGKSTFINILAGLVTKTSGTARIWGIDIDKHPREARAAIGVVPQEITMDPFFTPLEALELQAGFYGVPKSERRSMEILAAVGLDDKADAYVRQLSGGMKRRLMVAKALVHNPPVLILDEPTAGVDVELRRQLWDYVRELHARGTTIILTTHYLEEAQELCDAIAIVNHGEIIACESTQDLLKRLDHRTLCVMPKEPLSGVPAGLADLDAKIREDGALSITYRAAETGIGRLLEQVREAGVSIADLATEEPDLEDVFVALTTA